MAGHKAILVNVTVGTEVKGFRITEADVEEIWPDATPAEIAERVREHAISGIADDVIDDAVQRFRDEKIQMVD